MTYSLYTEIISNTPPPLSGSKHTTPLQSHSPGPHPITKATLPSQATSLRSAHSGAINIPCIISVIPSHCVQ